MFEFYNLTQIYKFQRDHLKSFDVVYTVLAKKKCLLQ